MKLTELVQSLKKKSGGELAPAKATDIDSLRTLNLPSEIVEFFSNYEPHEMIEINRARLWPISAILTENRDYVPGADVCPHGYVVIATTEYGDAYCVDLNDMNRQGQPSIVILPHDIDYEEILPGPLTEYRKVVAADFVEFLSRFVNGTLDTEPKYEGNC